MRIALVPLDSRPVNWQFPQRLADIAGIKLYVPPREMLGTLHHGADGMALARWLRDTVNGTLGGERCDAAIFSWDALLYGGLIQSRQLENMSASVELETILAKVDWATTAGYAYTTVPRLGLSITTGGIFDKHQLVREYFINIGSQEADRQAAKRVRELERELGEKTVGMLWRWRERNHDLACEALRIGARLGLKLSHVAVEDNAPAGPHLAEVEHLRQVYFELRRDYPSVACTFFDGADECAAMLLARAVIDQRGEGSLPVQLTVHPASPGPDRYTGRFETHSLGDGLTFLARFLRLQYNYDFAARHWLVAHGVQPQPDIFEEIPARIFNNPFLLPKRIPSGGRLFVTDLGACNGANPNLVTHVDRLAPVALQALVGFNTNFNSLGLTAAWLRLADDEHSAAGNRFLLERLADDLVYQSLARPAVLKLLQAHELDSMDFSDAGELQLDDCRRLVAGCWNDWLAAAGRLTLEHIGVDVGIAAGMRFSFPWRRAFEIEASLPELGG